MREAVAVWFISFVSINIGMLSGAYNGFYGWFPS